MEYSKLVSVTGMGGLFELVSSRADGAVVRSLEDKSTKFISSRQHNFSHLESIEIYTTKDNVNLSEVLLAMQASPEKLPDANDAKAVKAYFEKVYADIDFERVYASDMKKMVKWSQAIKDNGVEIKLSEIPDGDAPDGEKKPVTKSVEQKPLAVKNAPAKKIVTPRKAS